MPRFKQLLPVMLLAVPAVLVRLPFLEVPMISDEGGYAYVAHFWSDQYMPYRDIPFDRPQGIFLLYRAALAFGEGIGAIRLFAAIWNALTAVAVLFMIGGLFATNRARTGAWLGGMLYALFSAAPRIEGFTANAELFTLLPLTLAALATWRRRWLLAGLAAGAATAIKPTGVSGLLLALPWLLVTGARWRDAGRLLAGFALAPGLCLAHGALVDWQAYWNSFIDRRLLLFSVTSLGFGEQAGLLQKGVKETVSAWGALAVATAYTAFRMRDRTAAFLGLWCLASLGGMALGGMWHWHYFQQLIPPLAVGAGGSLAAFSRGRSQGRRPFLDLAWAVPAIAALALFVHGEAHFWFQQPKDISWELYRRPAYVVADEVGRYVQESTGPDDRIYVAFAEAELYYAARRKAAVPQLYFRDVEYSGELFEQAIAVVAAGTPAVVIKSQDPPPARMTSQAFIELLSRNYEMTAEAGPLQVWVHRGG